MQTRPVNWYITAPQHCPYLEDREMQTVLVDPAVRLQSGHYGQLLGEGFRRSGQFVYRHQCPSCRACVPVRIPVDVFDPSRGHRRCLQRNRDIDVRRVPHPDLDEHVALFQRYLNARHAGGGMEQTGRGDYVGMLSDSHCGVLLLEFRLASRLVAVAVTDVTPRGLSAMYTFFDPGYPARSLGTFAILRQIEEARHMALPYLYLGYWIPGSRKMAYKTGFRPVEGRVNGRWQRIGPP